MRVAQYHAMMAAMAAPSVALLLDHGLVTEWPFEWTRLGWQVFRSAPRENVYRRALLGDDSGLLAKVRT